MSKLKANEIIDIIKKRYKTWYSLSLKLPQEVMITDKVHILYDLLESVGVSDDEINDIEIEIKKINEIKRI